MYMWTKCLNSSIARKSNNNPVVAWDEADAEWNGMSMSKNGQETPGLN